MFDKHQRQQAIRSMRGKMRSPGRRVAGSPGRRVAGSPGRRVAGSAVDRSALGPGSVLGGDRPRPAQRGCSCGGRRGIRSRDQVVPGGWRDAAAHVGPGVGPLPVVHRARGDRHPARAAPRPVRSLAETGVRRRRCHASCGARRPAATSWRIGRRRPSGTSSGVRAARRAPSSSATTACGTTCRTAWLARSPDPKASWWRAPRCGS